MIIHKKHFNSFIIRKIPCTGYKNAGDKLYIFFQIKTGMEKAKSTEWKNAATELAGMIYGVSLDGVVTRNEYETLKNWCADNESLCEHEPFNGLYSKIKPIVDSGSVNKEELEEIEDILNKFLEKIGSKQRVEDSNKLFIKGLLKGILSSGDINDQEVYKLKQFLENQDDENLKSKFNGLKELIDKIWEDGKVDDAEFRILKDYMGLLIQVV